MDYAKQYGGGSWNYKTYDHLEAEWTNLNATANWLWETASVQGDTVGDKDVALMLNGLADALRRFCEFFGRWDEEIQLDSRGYEVASALQDWGNAGWRAQDLAFTYFNRARTDDAALWADQCAEAWARGGSKYEQGLATRMRGLVARQRKDYNDAERLLQEALAIFRDWGDEALIATGLNSLGGLESERKNYEPAEQYCIAALELARKINDKQLEANYMGSLGELALDREQWAKARKWCEQELPLAKEVGRQELVADAQYGLARVNEAEGRADLALPLAQDALKIYKRLQHRKLAAARELVERLKQPPPPEDQEKEKN